MTLSSGYLTPQRLVSPAEKRYHAIILTISLILWLLIAITIVGALYVAMIALVIWFANGLFIAYIRSEAVKVSEAQLPELDMVLKRCCQLLGVNQIPAMYVLQAGGALNAFATRRAGRDFVVLYSDIVEAYGWDSPEVAFVIGHELGHIQRRHIFKKLFTLPGTLVPLLGQAYSRACEATCDRYGMFCAQNPEGAVRAMMILSGGKEPGRKMRADAFARQHVEDRGFFVSWHELESGYPTLSQRVYNLMALNRGEPARVPRGLFAYLFAILFSRLTAFLLIGAYIGVIVVYGAREAKKAELARQNAAILQQQAQEAAARQRQSAPQYEEEEEIEEDVIEEEEP